MSLHDALNAIRAHAVANGCDMSVGIVLRNANDIVSFEVFAPVDDAGTVSVMYQARKAFESLGVSPLPPTQVATPCQVCGCGRPHYEHAVECV